MFSIVVALSALLVYLDATHHKVGKIPDQKGVWNISAGHWATFTLLLWIVGLPMYLIKRSALIESAEMSPQEPSNRTASLIVLTACVSIAFGITFSGFSPAIASPPSKMFDLSVPQAERITMVKQWVPGDYKWEESPVYSNFTISSNGTWSSTSCMAYGEVAERKFTLDGAGAWTVKEERYADTGKLVYLVKLTDPQKSDIDLAIDRDNGLMFVTVKGVKPVFKKGVTTYCGS